jgi:hypothetical protein
MRLPLEVRLLQARALSNPQQRGKRLPKYHQ